MQEFADLELSINRFGQEEYTVGFRCILPGSEADIGLGQHDQVQVSLSPLLDQLDSVVPDPQNFGKRLTDTFFQQSSLKAAFGQAFASAQAQGLPLRVRLWIGPGAPELHRLPWELLCNPQDGLPLSLNENITFSRYLSSADWRPVRLRPRGQLKALAAIANPENLSQYKLAPLDVNAETARIQDSLGDIDTTILSESAERATSENILARLRAEVDILLIVAHGVMVKGRPVLYLEDAEGKLSAAFGDEFAEQFKTLKNPPRLVVLLSCQSAGTGSGEVLSALGPRLVEAGVPAVLAMQGNLSMQTGAKFLPAFFKALNASGQIDQALAVARISVRDLPDQWLPALFMRLKSGRLWYTPGFSGRSSGADYETEIRYILRERCTPIVGPGLLEPLIGPSRDMATDLSTAFNFPLSPFNRDALPKVMQFLATDKGDAVPFDEFEDYIRRSLQGNFKNSLPPELAKKTFAGLDELVKAIGTQRRDADPNDPYRVLAKLPFSIYIVATPDRLLEDALTAEGRTPEVMISPWNARLAQRKTVFDLHPDYEPSTENPLVFYLFGRWNERASMVLTEDEYIRYLIGFTSNKAFVPEQVRLALSDTLLLFLGFQTEEWAFRVIFHSILAQAGSDLLGQYAHIAVQVEPEDERTLEPLRARRYLEKYFIKGANINVFWGQAAEYLSGLNQKWEARRV